MLYSDTKSHSLLVYYIKRKVKNMIIWIDGVNGIGKSHIAAELAERLVDKNAEYVESDLYWMDFLGNEKNYLMCILGHQGFTSNSNKYFLGTLRKTIEEKHDSGKLPIVSMSLVNKLCESELLDYFEKKDIPMLHIILKAKAETIISRIENDPIRNQSAQQEQKYNVTGQITYLESEYPNAVRINTDDKTLDEIANEIVALL